MAWVNYPGLAGQQVSRAREEVPAQGRLGLLNFGVKGGAKAGERFIEAAQFMSHLANIGDAKTLVIHPASTTHRQMSEEEQLKAGVTPDMIRMSVGIETLDDILWDIDQALNEAGESMISYQIIEHGKPLQKMMLDTPKPQGTEVLVRVTRSGVCHSDLHIWDGYFDLGGGKRFYVKERGCVPPFTLGHEPFGIVEALGSESEGCEGRTEAHRLSPGSAAASARCARPARTTTASRASASSASTAPGALFDPSCSSRDPKYLVDAAGIDEPSPRRSPAPASPPTAPPPSCRRSRPRDCGGGASAAAASAWSASRCCAPRA